MSRTFLRDDGRAESRKGESKTSDADSGCPSTRRNSRPRLVTASVRPSLALACKTETTCGTESKGGR